MIRRFVASRLNVFIIMLVPSLVVLVVACTKKSVINDPPDCSGPAKSFTTDVLPVFQSSCAINSDCHASGSTNGPGAFTTYQSIYTSRGAIRQAVATGYMPQTGTLTADQRNAILCWIDAGAANN